MSDITPFLPSQLYGVIGWPLAQSLSPLLHNSGFQALGIPAVYLRWEVPPERLAAFVDSVRLLNRRSWPGRPTPFIGTAKTSAVKIPT